MKDFSFQGKVYLGERDTATGKPKALRWVDNASTLQLSLSEDTDKPRESHTGHKMVTSVIGKGQDGTFTLTLTAFSAQNLALALSGTVTDIVTGTVTAEAFPADLVVGDIIALDHRDVSDLVITDSTGTPVQLVEGTDYSIESAAGGLVKMLAVDTYTQPFKGAYSYAAATKIAAFTNPRPERYLLLDGINIADPAWPHVRVQAYRCSFDPVSNLDLIQDGQGNLELKGTLLYDAVNAATSSNGGYFNVELPDETA